MLSYNFRSLLASHYPKSSAVRWFHLQRGPLLNKTHYEALEISPKATQIEIKEAYYRLSKLYHPDKNKGSAQTGEKFREVTAAYEVLSNFRLRKLYDKGILHTAGAEFADQVPRAEDIVEDDAQTKFYKQRLKRTDAPSGEGETTHYDFDKWSKEQYSYIFKEKQEKIKRYDRVVEQRTFDKESLETDKVIYVIFFLGLFAVGLHFLMHKPHPYKTPGLKEKTKDA